MQVSLKRSLLAVVTTGLWINLSEFLRNALLLHSRWVEHYQSLGLIFPNSPMNVGVWLVWGFVFAMAIYAVSRKFGLISTALICWLTGFVLMWIVIGNLGMLPRGLLVYAIPLSLFECILAAFLCLKLSPPPHLLSPT